ncbi:MarR family winged helix-turn-helix transcriptional regulator [Actinomadura sp. HBU206391]|uniref:MarR family winged helix-turn-helix transcriptional regulator n=1 Tax=Actinomadura sp. HBU206391 TaxID=2731692 RepID=UPI0016504838|nr:MarR family transcriptional regulator [Actinomadura sp. HBU206391]MBC6459823.1 MarR family transcriptional regulator [Actinomadura sp. HBU206391]
MSDHAANLLGALAVAVADAQSAAMRTATGGDLSGVAALTTLLDHPGLSIRELSTVLGITHSGTVRLVDRLAGRGLVTRATGTDRRQAPLSLTGDGAAAARRALRARQDVLEDVLAPLDPGERDRFARLTAKLLAGIPHDRAHARQICRLCRHDRCRGDACPVGAAVDEAGEFDAGLNR